MKVIRCVSLADGSPGPADQFLAAYNNKTGESVWTNDRAKALKFVDAFTALLLWKSIHEMEPVRLDGKPNRPLTAFTVTIEEE